MIQGNDMDCIFMSLCIQSFQKFLCRSRYLEDLFSKIHLSPVRYKDDSQVCHWNPCNQEPYYTGVGFVIWVFPKIGVPQNGW